MKCRRSPDGFIPLSGAGYWDKAFVVHLEEVEIWQPSSFSSLEKTEVL